MARLGPKITIYQANQELPYGTANSQCMVCKINKLCMTISYFWLVCPIYFFPPLLFLFSVSVSLGSWSYFPQKRNKCNDSLLLSQVIFNFFFIYSFFWLVPSGDRKYKDIMVTAKCKRFFLLFFLISITESR